MGMGFKVTLTPDSRSSPTYLLNSPEGSTSGLRIDSDITATRVITIDAVGIDHAWTS